MKNRPGGGRVHFLLPRIVHAARARRLKSFRFIQLRTLLHPPKTNSFVFKQFRTLSQEHPGVGVPLSSVLLNRRSPRLIWRFKSFFFSRLSAFRNEPLAMRLAFSSDVFYLCRARRLCSAAGRQPLPRQACSRTTATQINRKRYRTASFPATYSAPTTRLSA